MLATIGMQLKIITYRGTIGNLSFLSPASLTTHLHRRVNKIICVSQAVEDFLNEIHWLWKRLPKGHAQAILKGHDLTWYNKPAADLTKFKLPADAFVVTFAGRNRPHKGIADLLNSAKYLAPGAPVYYLLLGRLANDKALEALIAASPYRDNIILAGFRTDAPALYRASDVFVMPSTKREGLSRAVIEAMASKTVAIVTNVGGLPEIVEEGKSGYIIQPQDPKALGEAIMKLVQNPSQKETMAKAAQERIKTKFNIDTTVAQTKLMFEKLLEE